MRHRLSPTTSSVGVVMFDMKAKPILGHPTDIDICCGRGKGVWSHPGNIKFKTVVEQNIQQYSEACSRNDKSMVIMSVVETMRTRGARFVKRDDDSGLWFHVGECQAREKTAHAIRDNLAKLTRSKISQQSQDAKKSRIKNNRQTEEHQCSSRLSISKDCALSQSVRHVGNGINMQPEHTVQVENLPKQGKRPGSTAASSVPSPWHSSSSSCCNKEGTPTTTISLPSLKKTLNGLPISFSGDVDPNLGFAPDFC